MKRMAFFFAAIIFPGILLMGQEEVWIEIPDAATGVSVEMPSLPKFEEITFYYNEQYVVKEIYSLMEDNLNLIFESQPLTDNSKKAVSRAIRKAIDFKALQLRGKPTKKSSLSRNGISYSYVELELASGKVTRSVLFVHDEKLFHIYVQGEIAYAFGMDANHFLGSWKLSGDVSKIPKVDEEEAADKTDIKEIEDADPDEYTVSDLWKKIVVNSKVEITFPDKPFKRTTFIEMGKRDVTVTAYSRYSEKYNLNYVFTHREYGNEEGQLGDDKLYHYILDQIVELNRVKLIRAYTFDSNNTGGKEFILSKGIRFYKLQMFRLDDTIYQSLVKGKRRNIDRPEVTRFFNSIKILQ